MNEGLPFGRKFLAASLPFAKHGMRGGEVYEDLDKFAFSASA
jgi:hypothetical protein